jgi:hypothetical protein
MKMKTNIVHSQIINFCTYNVRLTDNRKSVTIRASLPDAKKDQEAMRNAGFTSYIVEIDTIDVPVPVKCNVYTNRHDFPAFLDRFGIDEIASWIAKSFDTIVDNIFFIQG